jgi:quercetin dioxygenase-like cupin family protein
MEPQNFFNIDRSDGGVHRELAPGITTTVYTGDHAQISVVRFEANAKGTLHHHPEEQWGHCLSGSGTRWQGDDAVAVQVGDFWRTPGEVPHTMQAGPDGMVVMDIFAPPRKAYEKAGKGFATEEA